MSINKNTLRPFEFNPKYPFINNPDLVDLCLSYI